MRVPDRELTPFKRHMSSDLTARWSSTCLSAFAIPAKPSQTARLSLLSNLPSTEMHPTQRHALSTVSGRGHRDLSEQVSSPPPIKAFEGRLQRGTIKP